MNNTAIASFNKKPNCFIELIMSNPIIHVHPTFHHILDLCAHTIWIWRNMTRICQSIPMHHYILQDKTYFIETMSGALGNEGVPSWTYDVTEPIPPLPRKQLVQSHWLLVRICVTLNMKTQQPLRKVLSYGVRNHQGLHHFKRTATCLWHRLRREGRGKGKPRLKIPTKQWKLTTKGMTKTMINLHLHLVHLCLGEGILGLGRGHDILMFECKNMNAC